MVDAFDGLRTEVLLLSAPEGITGSLIAIIEEAVKKRQNLTPDNCPMVREDYSYFDLMCALAMVDIPREVRLSRDSSLKSPSGPRYWPLSQKAIKLHRDLCEERYHG